MKSYLPNTPKEFSFIGSSIARLGTAISGALLVTDHRFWAFGSVGLTWLGHEICMYFKLQAGEPVDNE